jgi:hypothetical protein
VFVGQDRLVLQGPAECAVPQPFEPREVPVPCFIRLPRLGWRSISRFSPSVINEQHRPIIIENQVLKSCQAPTAAKRAVGVHPKPSIPTVAV